jgi:hypothetical protein
MERWRIVGFSSNGQFYKHLYQMMQQVMRRFAIAGLIAVCIDRLDGRDGSMILPI